MQMFNNLEQNHLVTRIHKLVDDIQAIGPLEEKGPMFDQVRSLLSILEKDARPVSWFALIHSDLQFIESETLPLQIRMSRTATRAEAIDMRNRLVFEGLSFFRLNFGPYGDYVEPLRDSPQSEALDRMRLDYGHEWKVFRNTTNDTYNFARKNAEEETLAESLAGSMADEVKERWPWAWIVVRVPIIVAEGEPSRSAKQTRR